MNATTDFARAHGHTGPNTCWECGTTANLHLLIWGNPETGESGTSMECCDCGIAAGDPLEIHDGCEPDAPDEGDEDPGPIVRVFRRDAGWTMTDPGPEPCTTNFHRQQDGRPPCTATAVWKVVEEHASADGYPMLTIGFYCDADLPAEHRSQAGAA